MKIITLFIISIFLLGACANCKKSNTSSDSSKKDLNWFQSKKEGAIKEGYEEISSYLYQGDTVYLFVPPCCDRFSELYTSTGSLICHPSGGITGKGDGQCPDFFKEAKKIKTFELSN